MKAIRVRVTIDLGGPAASRPAPHTQLCRLDRRHAGDLSASERWRTPIAERGGARGACGDRSGHRYVGDGCPREIELGQVHVGGPIQAARADTTTSTRSPVRTSNFIPNFQVSQGTSNVNGSESSFDYGDYTHAAFQSGTFYPAWSDNSNSTGDNPDGTLHQLDLYTARVVIQ